MIEVNKATEKETAGPSEVTEKDRLQRELHKLKTQWNIEWNSTVRRCKHKTQHCPALISNCCTPTTTSEYPTPHPPLVQKFQNFWTNSRPRSKRQINFLKPSTPIWEWFGQRLPRMWDCWCSHSWHFPWLTKLFRRKTKSDTIYPQTNPALSFPRKKCNWTL